MKLTCAIFSFLFLWSCSNQNHKQNTGDINKRQEPIYWVKKKIDKFYISIPSNYKMYFSVEDSATDGYIVHGRLYMSYGAGSFIPKITSDEKVLKIDTIGSLISKISLVYLENDYILSLSAWDTSIRIDLFGRNNEFYGFNMDAKGFNQEQRDTILKIFNSLTVDKK